jgi:hypothetical protein
MVIGRAVLPVRLGCRVEVIGDALSVGFFDTGHVVPVPHLFSRYLSCASKDALPAVVN